jgi:hypothetical protein
VVLASVVYATRGLLDALLDIASARDPTKVSMALTVTPAADLGVDLPKGTAVFTDFYLSVQNSVDAVFGVDLGTPRSQGRFVSHPSGPLAITREDDLHEVVFVAVPPWDRGSIRAFTRSGKRLPLDVLDVEPPRESLPT